MGEGQFYYILCSQLRVVEVKGGQGVRFWDLSYTTKENGRSLRSVVEQKRFGEKISILTSISNKILRLSYFGCVLQPSVWDILPMSSNTTYDHPEPNPGSHSQAEKRALTLNLSDRTILNLSTFSFVQQPSIWGI